MSLEGEKNPETKVTIKIPRPLYNRLRTIVEDGGFNSVTDFVVYVLRDLVSTHSEKQQPESVGDTRLSPYEIEAIRKRLKSLGYL